MPVFRRSAMRVCCVLLLVAVLHPVPAASAQEVPPPSAAPVQALRAALEAVQSQLAETRRETEALRQKVEALEGQLATLQRGLATSAASGADQDLLAAKVEDQEQTKVASGSKYRMRLSGFVLVNWYSFLQQNIACINFLL